MHSYLSTYTYIQYNYISLIDVICMCIYLLPSEAIHQGVL